MDASSELVHSLLPVFLVLVLGASMVTVGLLEGVAGRPTASTANTDELEATGKNVLLYVLQLTEGGFDAVLMLHVLEHIDHPIDFLRDIRERAAILIVEVPRLSATR